MNDELLKKKALVFDLIRKRDELMREIQTLNSTIASLTKEIEKMEKNIPDDKEKES